MIFLIKQMDHICFLNFLWISLILHGNYETQSVTDDAVGNCVQFIFGRNTASKQWLKLLPLHVRHLDNTTQYTEKTNIKHREKQMYYCCFKPWSVIFTSLKHSSFKCFLTDRYSAHISANLVFHAY